jgi:UDP-N-acetylmuramoylalanine-D-glutamate ligase
MIRVQFRAFHNACSPLTLSFKSVRNRMKFVVEINIIDAFHSGSLGTTASSHVFSLSVVSVSMSLFLGGVKILPVNTVFGNRF